MQFTILMPAHRPQNWPIIRERLEEQEVEWCPIVDSENREAAVFEDADWIKPFVASPVMEGLDICYAKLNQAIEAGLNPDRWYHFLCDDDLVPNWFYKSIAHHDLGAADCVVVTALRGQNQIGPHHATTLLADPDNMQPGRVTLSQLIVHGSALSDLRFDSKHSCADGLFAENLVHNWPAFRFDFHPYENVYFNALQPGRWNNQPQ